jgi:ankyrin repeat protein
MDADDLFRAVREGDIARVKDCIRAGVDTDARDGEGVTPLLVAAATGDVAMVRALLSGGADVRAAGQADGMTALHHAARRNDVAMIDELFGNGGLVDARARDGATPLALAARAGHSDACRELVERGADEGAISSPRPS